MDVVAARGSDIVAWACEYVVQLDVRFAGHSGGGGGTTESARGGHRAAEPAHERGAGVD